MPEGQDSATTIVGLATPTGVGGIGIVKISGPGAVALARTLFRRGAQAHGRMSVCPTPPQEGALRGRRITHGFLVDPDSREVLDEVLLLVMSAPRSYTGEDVVEIQAHGGPLVIGRILKLVLTRGCRLAEPGEFTRRAFLSGRIDLTQAEAVIELVQARHRTAAAIAMQQLAGGLSGEIESALRIIEELRAGIEAGIDFPDEICDVPQRLALREQLRQELIPRLERLVQNQRDAKPLREGTRVVIAGRPNVGKSSLFNRLLGADRALVTPIAGTTRDTLEGETLIAGLPLTLVDCAGLHDTRQTIEALGIERTLAQIDRADLVLAVVDGSRALTKDDHTVMLAIEKKPHVLLINKSDLPQQPDLRHTIAPLAGSARAVLRLSSQTGEGIEAMRTRLRDMILEGGAGSVDKGDIVPNLRQSILLGRCLEALKRAGAAFDRGESGEDMVGEDLRDASRALDEILGGGAAADLLDRIFSRFCIGK
jgi:tRNA modification GTPase